MLVITSGRHNRKKPNKKQKSMYRFPGFCGREIHIAGRISLHPLQNTVPVISKRRNPPTFTLFLEENSGLLSPSQPPCGPTPDLLLFPDASLRGSKPFPIHKQIPSAELRENYTFPATCTLASTALDRTDFHCCL